MRNLALMFGLLLATAVSSLAQAARTWEEVDIRASRRETPWSVPALAKPMWAGDPDNLFLVIEADRQQVSLVDGVRFEIVHRFALPYAQHDTPKFSPDGRYVYLGSRDGWIMKYDLWSLRMVAETRAGLILGNLALSGDGRWVMVASTEPPALVLLDADLQPVRSYALPVAAGKSGSATPAVQTAFARKSFIVTFKDISEIWELSYNRNAEPIFDGLVHDYRMGEAIAKPGFLGVRRTVFDEPLDALFLAPDNRHLIGVSQPKVNASPTMQVFNFDIRRRIAMLTLSDVPASGSALAFPWNETVVMLFASLRVGAVRVLDLKSWKLFKSVALPGPVLFLRGHEKTASVWVGIKPGFEHGPRLVLIDKTTLATREQELVPQGVPTHIEFTVDGRYALVSLYGINDTLMVYDTRTMREVARVPMRAPAGIYNTGNRFNRP